MDTMQIIITVVVALVAILVGFVVGIAYRKKIAEAEIGGAEEQAKNIIKAAEKEADSKKKEALLEAKDDKNCAVVHICTTKGKGYKFAEERPDLFHGVSGFDIETGVLKSSSSESFSDRFGKIIVEEAEKNEKIVAITAAMPDGTGLSEFSKRFPDRFFDVGIAEEHALTFACGLATEGIIPVFAVYSTFAQRAFDQLIHDAALQNLHIIVALDRAGLVANDGATHHGIFDTSFISQIPNVTLFAPNDFESLSDCFRKAITANGPIVIRYPKGNECDTSGFIKADGFIYKDFGANPKNAIITYGRLTENAVSAAELCNRDGINARVMSIKTLNPLPLDKIFEALSGIDNLVFAEEGIKNGGVSQRICSEIVEKGINKKVIIKAIDGIFPEHGSNDEILESLNLSTEEIKKALITVSQNET